MAETFEVSYQTASQSAISEPTTLPPHRPFLDAAARFLARHQLDPRGLVTFVNLAQHRFVVNWSTRSIQPPSSLAMTSTQYWLVEYTLPDPVTGGERLTWYHRAETEADARCFVLDQQYATSDDRPLPLTIHPPGSGIRGRPTAEERGG